MKKGILTFILILSLLITNSFANVCNTTYKDIVPLVENIGFTITSTTTGRHNKGSKHYIGKAVDIRTRDKSEEEIAQLIALLTSKGYVVIDERLRPKQGVWSGPHIHAHAPDCVQSDKQPFTITEFKNPLLQ